MRAFPGCWRQSMLNACFSDKFALHSPVFSPFGEAEYDRHLSPSKTAFFPPSEDTATALKSLVIDNL
jgi:hypothetical protein